MSLPVRRALGLLVLALGLFSAAAWMGSVAWREYELLGAYQVARAITNGSAPEIAKAQEAAAIADSFAGSGHDGARAAFVINSWLWERFGAARATDESNVHSERALKSQILLLQNNPADSLGWYGFARLRSELQGVDEIALDAVRLSYALGPSEGWISPIRLRYLFLLWDMLPGDIQHMIEVELDSVFRDIHMFKQMEYLIGPTRPFGPEVIARMAEPYQPGYAKAVREIAARPD